MIPVIQETAAKKVELLAKIHDHVTNKFLNGFRILSLCWSDGNSLLPIDFALLSSNKAENRYQEINDKIDKRSCGYQRRKEAISKSTDLILPMVKRALRYGIKAKYILFDSWYSFPSLIIPLKSMIDVICMVKKCLKYIIILRINHLPYVNCIGKLKNAEAKQTSKVAS